VYPYNIFDKVEEEESENVEEIIMGNRKKFKPSDSEKPTGGRRRIKRKDTNNNNSHRQDFEVIKDDLDIPEVRKLFTDDHLFKFGTPNPELPLTDVPCGGCGALLHCKDPKMPGYAPSQLIDQRESEELRSLVCQRCYVIKEYKVALKVNVSPEDYPRTLEHIKDEKALIILMVDLLDFPGSVWPNLMNLLGKNKSVILVGNKIDLILPDSGDYIRRISKIIRDVLLTKCWESESEGFPQIIDTICLSAKTGFNVERLLAKVFSFWKAHHSSMAADIYIVGTTNVGKSSLFNLLLDSDLCKIRAVDLVQKAITSPVPGITLSLLKFPITRPEPHFINSRRRRLQGADRLFRSQENERMENLRSTSDIKYAVPGLYNITHTLLHSSAERTPTTGYLAEVDMKEFEGKKLPARLDPANSDFAEGKWCYDTPGTVCTDQIINLLTAEEISNTLASVPLRPRTYLLREGHSVLLGGLARLDYTVGKVLPPLLITVFCANTLPIHIVETVGVEDFVKHSAGSDLQMVPSKENMDKLPELLGKEVHVTGEETRSGRRDLGAADVVLSSAGWVMITPSWGQKTTFVAYTPGGKGITMRPPYLPHSIHQRGFRIKGSPAYANDRLYTKESDSLRQH